ncbi:MAG: AAA family ATPase [Candidatus Micrarchaeota archaeon]|nr:AAA family ATPase [Candidatus Micrarchaeota archaeon]
MINKVILKNWKCHTHSELEFSEGTNCLIGIIGAGKTSVLDAICFGLFGTFPQLNQKKIKLEDVITKKPVQASESSVTVRFEINGKEYTVKRTVRKGKSTAELFEGDRLIEAQPKKVTEIIENLLKMNYDLFTRAVYSEQNQLDMFLTIPKGKRMKKIDELLKLDNFEKARATTTSLANRFKVAVRERETVLESFNRSELEELRVRLEKDVKTIREKITFIEAKLGEVRAKKEKLRAEITKLEEIEKKRQSLKEKLGSLNSVNRQLSSDIERLEKELKGTTPPDVSAIEKSITELEEKQRAAVENIDRLRKELSSSKEELALKKFRFDEMKKLIEEAEKLKTELDQLGKPEREAMELEKKMNELHQRAGVLRGKLNELKKNFASLSSLGPTCPTCLREISEEKKNELLQKISREREEAERQLKEIENELKNTELKLAEVRKRERKFSELKKKLEQIPEEDSLLSLEKEITDLNRKITEGEKTLRQSEAVENEVRRKIQELRVERERAVQIIAKFSELERKRRMFTENSRKIHEIISELSGLAETDALPKLREEYEKISAEETRLLAELESSKAVLNERSRKLEETAKQIKTIEEMEREIEKFRFIASQLEILENVLQKTQEELRKNFVSAINQVMHSIWQELYPYGDFTSIRLAVDGDYILQLRDRNGWVSAEAVSGGERSLACLTLRIAFALVLAPQLRWLVLDEPTHNLDARATEELARILRERITEFVDQVFLITHEPALEDAVSGFLYRIERNKEKDEPARVIKLN